MVSHSKSRTVWKMVRVPKELHDRISTLADREGVAKWKIVSRALTFLESWRRAGNVKKLPRFDKACWYIYKLASSVGIFKEVPSDDNYQKLLKTISQIEERLGIDCSLLKKAVEDYKRRPTVSNKIELNDVTKLVIGDIIAFIFLVQAQ